MLLNRLTDYLVNQGYLFLGGSEILKDISTFRRLKHNIYQKIINIDSYRYSDK
ncbi:MAG: hypothetical protein HQK77_13345 [Desulfobacterales bacterium]|nr:hypothetical protein [Desulfobacterales bacterium]